MHACVEAVRDACMCAFSLRQNSIDSGFLAFSLSGKQQQQRAQGNDQEQQEESGRGLP